jgi:quinol monooxygenase YgiN
MTRSDDPAGVITLVAIIRAKPGVDDVVDAALAEVSGWVHAHEPRTLAYHVSRGTDDRALFTTFERFADRAAMDAHNASSAVAAFSAAVAGKLAAAVEIHVGEERCALARHRLPET